MLVWFSLEKMNKNRSAVFFSQQATWWYAECSDLRRYGEQIPKASPSGGKRRQRWGFSRAICDLMTALDWGPGLFLLLDLWTGINAMSILSCYSLSQKFAPGSWAFSSFIPQNQLAVLQSCPGASSLLQEHHVLVQSQIKRPANTICSTITLDY